MNKRYAVILGAIACGCASPSKAELVPVVDVPEMVQHSDLVVAGRVGAVWYAGQNTQGPIIAGAPFPEEVTLIVEEVFKGSLSESGKRILVQFIADDADALVKERQYGMFFLKRVNESDEYTATEANFPALPALPTDQPSSLGHAEPLAIVAAELRHVLTSPPSALTNMVSGIEPGIPLATGRSSEAIYKRTVYALITIPALIASDPLRSSAETAPFPNRLWIIDNQFRHGDMSRLESIAPLLINIQPGNEDVVDDIGSALISNPPSERYLTTLVLLLHSNNDTVRRSAVYALRRIGGRRIISPLALLALNDKDEEVRYQSGLSLCEVVDPSAAVCNKHANEVQLTEFWRSWTAANIPINGVR